MIIGLFENIGCSDSVTLPVLKSWISTENLIRFDFALCNTKCRPLFLRLISDKYFTTFGLRFPRQYFCKTFRSWISTRSVKVRTLVYRRCNVLCKLESCLNRFGGLITLDVYVDDFSSRIIQNCCNNLRFLTLEGDNQSACMSIRTILMCSMLESIELSGNIQFCESSLSEHDTELLKDQSFLKLSFLVNFECKVRRGASQLIAAVIERSPNLISLDTLQCRDLTQSLLESIPMLCPRLTRCDLQPNLNSEEMCEYIVRNLPLLESTNTSVNSTNDGLIHSLATHGRRLTYLTLECTSSDVLTASALTLLGQNCPQLTKLDINYDTECSDEVLGRLLTSLPNLRVLNLELSSSLSIESLRLFDALRREEDRSLPALTDLNLSYCEQMDDESLCLVAALFPLLRALDLSGCRRVSNAGVELIAAGLTQLHRLTLSMCLGLNDDLFALETDEQDSSSVREATAAAVLFPSLRHFTAATEMALYVGGDMWGLSPQTVIRLVGLCPLLESLDMAHNDRMTDEAVRAVATRCPHLERLVLTDDVGHISEECFLSLERGAFPSLSYIDFFYVKNITELSVLHLISICPVLETIAIATHNKDVARSIALQECHRVDFYNANYSIDLRACDDTLC